MTRIVLCGAEIEIDDNMVKLVKVLNRLPGLSTSSCCGGHENPQRSQVSAGAFTVSIDVDDWWAGWRGLTMLTVAISDHAADRGQLDCVQLTTWFGGDDDDRCDDPQLLGFDLSGHEPAVPDDLATEIEATIEACPDAPDLAM